MKRNNQSLSNSSSKKSKKEESEEDVEDEVEEDSEKSEEAVEDEGDQDEEEEGDSETDDIEGELDTIWLNYHEFHSDNLPILLNSTSTRKKTIDNYVAPENIRNTTYRSKDFPAGIWITSSGKLDVNDPRSGIYKCLAQKSQKLVEEPISDSDSDASEQEEEEETSSEDDWDAEVDDKEKLNISESEKKAIAVEKLKKSASEMDAHFVFQQKSKQNQIRTRTLMDATQILVEDWENLKKKSKDLKMNFESSLHCEVPVFQMIFTKKTAPKPIKCNFDCKELILRCQCFDTFATLPEYVTHLKTSH
jgi:hypothetical protein